MFYRQNNTQLTDTEEIQQNTISTATASKSSLSQRCQKWGAIGSLAPAMLKLWGRKYLFAPQ